MLCINLLMSFIVLGNMSHAVTITDVKSSDVFVSCKNTSPIIQATDGSISANTTKPSVPLDKLTASAGSLQGCPQHISENLDGQMFGIWELRNVASAPSKSTYCMYRTVSATESKLVQGADVGSRIDGAYSCKLK